VKRLRIANLIRRDLLYQEATITPEFVAYMGRFAGALGLIGQPLHQKEVVAIQCARL
jgi:hypothetical protein